MIDKSKLNKNSISLAGEFAVLSQLSLRGFDANMTLGHTKGVDILVSDPYSGKMYKVEVKTSFKNIPMKSRFSGLTLSWVLNEKAEKISTINHFYCFVNIEQNTNSFRFFLIPSKIVSDFITIGHKKWLSDDKDHKDNPMRQFRIGLEDKSKYKIIIPLAKDYENNWNFMDSAS